MKRFDEHNAALGIAHCEQTGICPACRREECQTIFTIVLPGGPELLLGCERCTTMGELAAVMGGLLDLEAVQRGWVEH